MDDRQRQIREGAGLEESRLNVEFVDFLRKYGGIMMMGVAFIALAYWGLGKYRNMQDRRLDEAFSQLSAAEDSQSPTALIAVANDHSSMKGVADTARLEAADIFLDSARRGLALGAAPDQTGKYPDTDILTEEQKQKNLSDAADLYKAVVESTGADSSRFQQAISGLYGLAAVAEERGKLDEARAHYDRVVQLAKSNGLSEEIKRAQGRIDTLGSLAQPPRLYVAADLAANKQPTLTPIAAPPGGPASPDNVFPPAPSPATPPETPQPASPSGTPPASPPANPAPAPSPPPGR
jgi:tetratricopeptide (TPR) repeat protein